MRDPDRVQVGDEDRVVVNERERVTIGDAAPRVRRREEAGNLQVELPEALNLARDRVRWGPIWAGFFTALTAMVLLGLLGLAIGLTSVNAGTAAAQGGPPQGAGTAAAIWGAITALVAFFVGGWVAGRTAAVFDRRWGAWNGALVFIVAVPITLWLAGQGLGFLAGTLGNFASALNIDPGAMANQAQQAADQAQQAGRTPQPSDVAQAAAGARNAAWGTLIGLLVGLIAAALGGALGTRREVALERTTADVTRAS